MFDAYHKWLGIPPGRRPPTYYQLLGIDPTEQDRDVIEAAAVRQTAYVRNFQSGAHGKECARILGELAQARLVLLDLAKRAAYDARLAESTPPALAIRGDDGVQTTAEGRSDATPIVKVATVEAHDLRGREAGRASSGGPGRGLVPLAVAVCALAGLGFVVFKMRDRPTTTLPPNRMAPIAGPSKLQTTPSTRPAVAAVPGTVRGKSAPVPLVGVPAQVDRTAVYDIGTDPEGAALSATGMPGIRITRVGARYRVTFPGADGKTPVRLDATLDDYEFHDTVIPKPGEQRPLRLRLAPARIIVATTPKPFIGMSKATVAPPRPKPEEEVEAAAAPHPEPRVIAGETTRFEGKLSAIQCVAFHPKGTHVAVGDEDGKVRVWNRSNKIYRPSKAHHNGAVSSITFAPNGLYVLSGGQDGTVRLWDLKATQREFIVKGKDEVKYLSVLRANEKHLLILTSVDFSVLQDPEWKRVQHFDTRPPGKIVCMAVAARSRAGGGVKPRSVVTGDDAGLVKLWNPETGGFLANLLEDDPPSTGEIVAVALSPDGSKAVAAGQDRSLRLWDFSPSAALRGPTKIRLWKRNAGRITCLAFSPDGRHVLSGGDAVRLWDVEQGYETAVLRGHTDDVTGVAFSPDGHEALTGSLDRSVRLWDLFASDDEKSGDSKAVPD